MFWTTWSKPSVKSIQTKKNEFVIKSSLNAIWKWILDIPVLIANVQDHLEQTKWKKKDLKM